MMRLTLNLKLSIKNAVQRPYTTWVLTLLTTVAERFESAGANLVFAPLNKHVHSPNIDLI